MDPSFTRPVASLIIPQHQFPELTLLAVSSFQRFHGGSPEIVVVDDGSRPSRPTLLQSARIENLTIVRLPKRRGVTAAWNRGAAVARGRNLIFLNNDTQSTGAWLEDVVEMLRQPQVKVVGGSWRQSSSLEQRLTCSPRFLQGWLLALTRESYVGLGGFDERFTMYFSDTDLQWRALKLWSDCLAACESLPLKHKGHASTRHWKQRSTEWRIDRDLFQRKWG